MRLCIDRRIEGMIDGGDLIGGCDGRRAMVERDYISTIGSAGMNGQDWIGDRKIGGGKGMALQILCDAIKC